MFENLTDREKKLAMIVGALAPIVIVALAFFWFLDKYQGNQTQITQLESTVETEENKTRLGLQANTRKAYYRSVSLPSRKDNARSTYMAWLKNLVRNDIQMEYRDISPGDNGAIQENGQTIGSIITFSLKPEGTYEQVLQFLEEFYAADHLHRIKSLTIKPVLTKARDSKTVLSGRLKLNIEIEVLALKEADPKFENFPRFYRALKQENADYQASILGRNIFGPANNTPILEVTQRPSYLPNQEISLTLRATDADKNNVLGFEIVESKCDIEGITLGEQPGTAKMRSIPVTIPAQEKDGTYKVVARVFDNGLPSKSSEKSFNVVVKTPKVTPPAPPKPDYEFAKVTFIAGHLRNADGIWEVIINSPTKPDTKAVTMRAGDVMDLDKKKWTLEKVDETSVVFNVDGEVMRYGTSGCLGDPIEEEEAKDALPNDDT
jgi:hypothetical protein